MSFRVVAEVLERSRARGTDRLVLIALAEFAHHDGVSWRRIGGSETDADTICAAALCSKREAIRAVQALRDELREIETRKVRRGRSFVTVYRVLVGSIRDKTVEYGRIPFEVEPTFLHGDELARWVEGRSEPEATTDLAHRDDGQGDDLAPSIGPFMVPPEDVQGDIRGAFKVTPSRARVEREPPENHHGGSSRAGAREPSLEDGEDPRRDPRLQAARIAKGDSAGWLANIGRICAEDAATFRAECPLTSDRAVAEELRRIAGGETPAQARSRWLEEKASDPGFPLEEIKLVVASWEDVDDVERQDAVDRAEAIRAGDEHAAKKAAA